MYFEPAASFSETAIGTSACAQLNEKPGSPPGDRNYSAVIKTRLAGALSRASSPKGDAAMQKNMGTTGTSKQRSDASQQGADKAASVGAKGDSTEPGKVKDGKPRLATEEPCIFVGLFHALSSGM